MASNSPHPAKSGGSHPFALIVIGLLALLFWILWMMFSVATSEALLLHGAKVSALVPNWMIFAQPVNLAMGNITEPSMSMAIMGAWSLKIIFLVFIYAFEASHTAIHDSNRHMSRLFLTGAFLLMAVDFWADFQYGQYGQLASGTGGQILFAAIMVFVGCFLGTAGIACISYGFKNWR